MRWMLWIVAVLCFAGVTVAQEEVGEQEPPAKEKGEEHGDGVREDDHHEEDEEGERELSEEDLLVMLEKKLASEFVKMVPWQRDLESAREISTKEKKPIVVYFTRSDAECGPCSELEERFLGTDAFVEASDGFVPMLRVWSGVGECSGEESEEEGEAGDRGDAELVSKEEGPESSIAAGQWPESFPFVAVLDPDGEFLFELDTRAAGDRFTELVSIAAGDARALSEARAKLEKKKRHKKSEAVIALIESLRGIEERDMKKLEKAAQTLEDDEALMARFGRYRVIRPIERAKEHFEAEMNAAMKMTQEDPEASREKFQAARLGAQDKMYEFYEAGSTIGDKDEPLYDYFWRNTMYAAIEKKDKRGAAISYNALAKIAEENPTVKMILLGIRKRIESM